MALLRLLRKTARKLPAGLRASLRDTLRRTPWGQKLTERAFHASVDVFVLSFPKTGRTWLRLMLGRLLSQHYGIDAGYDDLLHLKPLTARMPGVPLISVTHDDDPQTKTPDTLRTDKEAFRGKRVILLYRDLRDVLVSLYFQGTKRAAANQLPSDGSPELATFSRAHVGSLETMIRYYNIWAENRHVPDDFLLVRYEDMHEDAARELRRVVEFLGLEGVPEESVTDAVEFASFQNMQRMEREGLFSSARMRPGRVADQESYKTRRGKVGGYADYMDEELIREVTARIRAGLSGFYDFPTGDHGVPSSRLLRILHIYKDYDPVLGGIENHVRELARAQAARGHEVTVLVCNPGGLRSRENLDGVELIRAHRLFTAQSMPISISQPLITARQRPDIVHVHSPYPLGEVCAWLFQRLTPLVITHHSDVLRQKTALRLYAPLLRRVLAASDRIITTSPQYIDSSAWLAPVREKCTVIPLGVDVDRFSPPSRPFDGPPTLLFVGKLRHYKGLDTLIRALADLPGVRLEVVGDGPMRAPWEALAGELGLENRIHFHGEIEDADLPAAYHKADMFVLPSTSRAEAFGTVLLEAMASGLPCVTTEVRTGTSWVVQHGVTGFVVAHGDARKLVAALRELLEQPQRRADMGRAGRRRAETEFSAHRMIERVTGLYEEIARGNSIRAGRGEKHP